MNTRREFIGGVARAGMAVGLVGAGQAGCSAGARGPLYEISLAEWSVNKRVRKAEGFEPLDHLDFAKLARELGIGAVEYVNTLFEKGAEAGYVAQVGRRAEDHGVKSLLIMVDREGQLGDPDDAKRAETVENHKKWLDAAAALGCHSIRVNAASKGTPEEQMRLAADGLRRLSEEGEKRGLNVLVENHGGLSSNGEWLVGVIEAVDHPRCGILPDFGNFYIDRKTGEKYDPYKGVAEFMPYAKAVSAKSYDWDTGAGKYVTEDTRPDRAMKIDYLKMMKIVVDAGYRGFVGIEYEGEKHAPEEGILKTKAVLEAVRDELAKG